MWFLAIWRSKTESLTRSTRRADEPPHVKSMVSEQKSGQSPGGLGSRKMISRRDRGNFKSDEVPTWRACGGEVESP